MTLCKQILAVAALALSLSAQQPGAAQAALKAAIDKEVADGDIKAAIALYDKVATTHKANKSVAAQALLRLGQCQERLGQNQASQSYERLLQQYGDQKEAVTARARLAVLGKVPAAPGAMSAQLLARQPGIRIAGSRIASDGRTLPYRAADGHIYVRDLQSGESRRISSRNPGSAEAYGWGPVPSRDGARIAYSWTVSTESNDLYVASASGGNVRTVPLKLGERGWVMPWDWSPDGKHLLVWAVSNNPPMWNMAIVDVDTAELRHLSAPRAGRCVRGNFSADGRLIVASCRKDERSGWDIFVVDPVSGKETAIVTDPGNDSHPLWLPAPGQIVFVSDRLGANGLWRVEYKNGVASAPVLLQADIGDATLLGAAKDGSIVYGREHSSHDIYLANLDPESFRVQGAPARFVESYLGRNRAPSWSPSGNAFAYSSHRDRSGRGHLVIRGLDATETVLPDPLTWAESKAHWCSDSQLAVWGTPHASTLRIFDSHTGAIAQPDVKIDGLKAPYQLAYSPDCRSVYVSSYSEAAQQRRVFRIDLETKRQTGLLTDNAPWSLAPAVSPDGRWLALRGRVGRDGNDGIILIPAAGGAPRLIVPDTINKAFSWTPDSKRLLFVGGAQDRQEIYSVSIDGAPPQPTGIRMAGLSGPSLHPDGKRLLFTAADSVSEIWSLRNLPTK